MKFTAVRVTAQKYIQSFFTMFFHCIAPPFCFYCKEFLGERDVFCMRCYQLIIPVVSTILPVTATKKLKVFAISNYQDPIKSLILAKGRSDIIAARQLGELIWSTTYSKNIKFDYLIPIPLHWSRFAKRGFNQAQQMAKVLSSKSGRPVVSLLKRTKRTKYQAQLTQDARAKNVKEAFMLRVVDRKKYRDKHLVIVDDLMTTGSTLKAAARQLYRLKPASITVFVACRVV